MSTRVTAKTAATAPESGLRLTGKQQADSCRDRCKGNSRLKASRTRKWLFQDADELGEVIGVLLQRLGIAVVNDMALI